MKNNITQALVRSTTYLEYKKKIADLLLENKVTGNEQTADLLHYSSLNLTRMNRLDKTFKITDENRLKIKGLKKQCLWLVISEGWCGDAAQILPVLHKISEDAATIEMKIVLRDENDSLMNLYLTKGGKAIPIVLLIDKENGEVIANWGPRPQGAADLIENYKATFGSIDATAKTELQLWYLHDKGVAIQNEILEKMLTFE